MKRRLLALVLVLSLILSLVVGCKSKDTTTPTVKTAGGKEPYKFVFIAKGLSHVFSMDLANYGKTAAKLLGIELEIVGPQTNFSTEEQIALIEDAITADVDAIIIAPADSKAIVPGIEKANKAGIPIATPNTKAYGGDVVTWAGVDNHEVGYRLGLLLAESINFKGNVVILEGIPGSSTSTERVEGYNEALAKYPDIKILASQTANYKRDEGMTVMENLLQKYPSIDGVGSADQSMLMGANEAIKEAGRTGIKGVGFDVAEDACVAIKNGEIVATGDQQPASQAFWAVVACWAELEGYTAPEIMYIPMAVVDSKNVDSYLAKYKK